MEEDGFELPLSALAAMDAGIPAVQALRQWRGYGITALALASGVPACALSEHEAGRRDLTIHDAELVAAALNVPAELLLELGGKARAGV